MPDKKGTLNEVAKCILTGKDPSKTTLATGRRTSESSERTKTIKIVNRDRTKKGKFRISRSNQSKNLRTILRTVWKTIIMRMIIIMRRQRMKRRN